MSLKPIQLFLQSLVGQIEEIRVCEIVYIKASTDEEFVNHPRGQQGKIESFLSYLTFLRRCKIRASESGVF